MCVINDIAYDTYIVGVLRKKKLFGWKFDKKKNQSNKREIIRGPVSQFVVGRYSSLLSARSVGTDVK